jgi:flagellar basal-body rod protein FlgB
MRLTSEASPVLKRLMSATTLRRDVLANNIASQNLPGYRRREVNFEEKLAQAIEKGADNKDLERMSPEIVLDWDTPARADGNNVSAEEEASLMRENRIRFELYAMLLKGNGSLIAQAINGDR